MPKLVSIAVTKSTSRSSSIGRLTTVSENSSVAKTAPTAVPTASIVSPFGVRKTASDDETLVIVAAQEQRKDHVGQEVPEQEKHHDHRRHRRDLAVLLPEDDAEDLAPVQRLARLQPAGDLVEAAGDEGAEDRKAGASRQGPPELPLGRHRPDRSASRQAHRPPRRTGHRPARGRNPRQPSADTAPKIAEGHAVDLRHRPRAMSTA